MIQSSAWYRWETTSSATGSREAVPRAGATESGRRIDAAAAAGNSLAAFVAAGNYADCPIDAKNPHLMISGAGFSVEVRGVEPLSANRSLPVSTCVFYCSFLLARSSASRQPLTSQPYRSYSSGYGPGMSQSEFSSPVVPTQTGLTDRREVRNQLGFYLRSQGEVIVRSY